MTSIYNTAYASNFRIEFLNSPRLNYFVQSVSIPGISAMGPETPTKGHNTFFQADRIEYDPLNITFLVDENFENYLYLFAWIKRDVETERPSQFQQDATLHILTNNKTQNLVVKYYGMFPQMLGSIDLENAVNDSPVLTCSCTFRYQYFRIERMNEVQ